MKVRKAVPWVFGAGMWLAACFLGYQREGWLIEKFHHNQGVALSAAYADFAGILLSAGEDVLLLNEFQRLASNPQVISAGVVDQEGRLRVHTSLTSFGEPYDIEQKSHEKAHRVERDVALAGGSFGKLWIDWRSPAPLIHEGAPERVWLRAGFFGLLMIGLGCFSYLVWQRSVASPVSAVAVSPMPPHPEGWLMLSRQGKILYADQKARDVLPFSEYEGRFLVEMGLVGETFWQAVVAAVHPEDFAVEPPSPTFRVKEEGNGEVLFVWL